MKLIVATLIIFILTLNFVMATSAGPPSCSQEVVNDIKLKHEQFLPLLSKDIIRCSVIPGGWSEDGLEKISYVIEGSIYSSGGNKYEYSFEIVADATVSYIEYPKFKSEESMVKFVDFIENLDIYQENVPLFYNPRKDISNNDPIIGYSSNLREGEYEADRKRLLFYFRDNKLLAYTGFSDINTISETSALEVYDVSELDISTERVEVGASEFEEVVDQSNYRKNNFIFYFIVLVIILIIIFVLFRTFKKRKSNKV